MFTVIPNHFQQAVARLLQQYQTATNLQNFMAAIIQPVQDIEYQLNDLNVQRELANAVGVQLDNIGTIVGLARPAGATDSIYRQELYGQIGINVSQGQPEQVIQTFQLFTQTNLVLLWEYFPAQIMLESSFAYANQAAVDAMIALVEEVAPAGVQCYGLVTFDSMIPFAMDGNLYGSGFGSDTDPTQGGLFAGLSLPDGQFAFAGDDETAEGFGASNDPTIGGEFVVLDQAPTFYDAQVPNDGAHVKIRLGGVALPPLLPAVGVTGFTVLVNSSPATISSAVTEFNSKILLAISSPLIHSGDTVTIAYTPGNVTDSDGNALGAFGAQPVLNNSTM